MSQQAKKAVKTKRQVRMRPVRVQHMIRGDGTFWDDVKGAWMKYRKYVPRVIGGVAGTLTGRGWSPGYGAGAAVSKNILGWGGFTVPWTGKMNSLASKGTVPTMANYKDTGLIVRHTEFIGYVNSSTQFSRTVYALNPGINTTFPWLNYMANGFQQYRLLGAVVTFKSAMSVALATYDSMGVVMIGTDLNPGAEPPHNEVEMEQLQFVASAKTTETIVAPIECAPLMGGSGIKYVRAGAIPSSLSIADFDHGQLIVATNGCPSGGKEIGRLYLSFEVELLNPRLSHVGGTYALWSVSPGTSDWLASPVQKHNDIGAEITGQSVTLPPGSLGTYTFVYCATGSTAASLTNAINVANVNCTAGTLPDTTWYRRYPTDATAVTSKSVCFMEADSAADSSKRFGWTISAGTLPGGTVTGYVMVIRSDIDTGFALNRLLETKSGEKPDVETLFVTEPEEKEEPEVVQMPSAAGAAAGAAMNVSQLRQKFGK